MFNLFGRKPAAPPKPAAAPQGTPVKYNPASTAQDQMIVIARCVQHAITQYTFVGGLDADANYRVQTLPDGNQVAINPNKKIGVVLDKSNFAMSVAGVQDVELALVATNMYFEKFHKLTPKWQVEHPPYVNGTMTANIPINIRWFFQLSCDHNSVDTQFDGKKEPGCTLTIALRQKS